ncbi:MAG: SufD family Fe-S cluster assembly protein [bacterium]
MADVELALVSQPAPPTWLAKDAAQFHAEVSRALNSKTHRERWKYTRTQPILDMLTASAVSPRWHNLPHGVRLQEIDHDHPDAPLQSHIDDTPEASSALCYHNRLWLIEASGNPQQPLIIEYQGHSAPVVLKVAANTHLELQEIYGKDIDQHQTLWIQLGPGSSLTHARNSFTQSKHWQFLRATVAKDAIYSLHNHSTGAELRRQDIQILCTEPGASAQLTSASQVGPGQHLDQQVTLEHRAAQTSSQQIVHNIVEEKAKVTFNGRIHIHRNCPKVAATLQNRNLALADHATINTKPELEIYTDDVTCAHGATVGQLDPQHLFYCASRGITITQARALLARAFLNTATTGPLAAEALNSFGIVQAGHCND